MTRHDPGLGAAYVILLLPLCEQAKVTYSVFEIKQLICWVTVISIKKKKKKKKKIMCKRGKALHCVDATAKRGVGQWVPNLCSAMSTTPWLPIWQPIKSRVPLSR